MPDTFELTRFIIAFFASGVFWLMVLFYAEKRWREHGLPGAGIAAGIVLTAAAILFFKVVVDDAPWKTPPPMWPDATAYSAVPPEVRPASVDSQVSLERYQPDRHFDGRFLRAQP